MSTVQILIEEEGNRGAVARLLGQRYDVSTEETVVDADLYIVDDHSLPSFRNELRARKQAEGTVFCPVVLVMRPESRVGDGRTAGTDAFRGTIIDEILTAPLDPELAERRLDNLLTRRDTTKTLVAQKEQLEAREEELTQYKTFVEESSDIIVVLDESGRIEYHSPSVEHVLGYGPDELVGTNGLAIAHPDDQERLSKTFGALLTGESDHLSAEGRYRTASGEYRWLAVRARREEDSNEGAVIANIRDITAQKRQEEKRERTINRMTDGVLELDSEWKFLEVNETAETILGIDSDAVLGEQIWEVFPEAVDTRFYDAYQHVMESREPTALEELFEELDTWFELNIYPEPHGGVSAYFRDVTERRARENRIERLNREFETVFENVQEALFLLAVEEGEITFQRANEATEQLLSQPAGEIRGQELSSISVDGDSALLDHCRQTVQKGEPVTFEYERADGEAVFNVQLTPVVIGGGVELIVGSAQDITERKASQERLESQRDDLQLLNQMVRHDIRNDLQVIRTYAEMLESKASSDDTGAIEKIITNADSAITLTEEARELAEVMLQSGKLSEPVPLADPLLAQIDQLRSVHEPVTVELLGTVPRVSVVANDMLDSLFQNLLHNAVLHNDTDHPEIQVAVTADGDTATIEIADNGPGIDEDLRESIFEKGEKGPESEGSGIGLYLVDKLVSQYEGEIEILDREDWQPPTGSDEATRGTVFVVELPLADSESAGS